MIPDELSNAFIVFSLRRLGAELEGVGCQTSPSPQHVVENADS